jgi:hypothetical protein
MRALFVAVLFAALLALPAPARAAPSGGGAGPQNRPDPRAVAASVSHDLHVQDRLPSDDRPWNARETSTDGGDWGGAAAGGGGSQSADLQWGVIFIVLGAVAAAGLAVLLLPAVPGFAGGRRSHDAAHQREPSARTGAPSHQVLASADELAAAGRYTEAMHQLLADALAVLRKRLDAELSDALTSREILRALALPQTQQSALRDMIARVEQTWFAQRAAALADYDAVRASFQAFTGAGTASA